MENVPTIVPLLEKEYRLALRRLEDTQDELADLHPDRCPQDAWQLMVAGTRLSALSAGWRIGIPACSTCPTCLSSEPRHSAGDLATTWCCAG